MTLTKKELMAAVKLCSDVAVTRGLPNMRIRPKSHVHHYVRAPFHAHPKKHQNVNVVATTMSVKTNVSSQPLVTVPMNSKGDAFNIGVKYITHIMNCSDM